MHLYPESHLAQNAIDVTRIIRFNHLGGVQQVVWDAIETGKFDAAVAFSSQTGHWKKVSFEELERLRISLDRPRGQLHTALSRLFYATNRVIPFLLPLAEFTIRFINGSKTSGTYSPQGSDCSLHTECPQELRVVVIDIPTDASDLEALENFKKKSKCQSRVSRVAYIHDLMPIFAPEMVDSKEVSEVQRMFRHYLHTVLKFEKLVANSNFTKSELEAFTRNEGISLPVLEVAYPPVSSGIQTSGRFERNETASLKSIFAIGPWNSRKRFHLLFDACLILARKGLQLRLNVLRNSSSTLDSRTVRSFEKLQKEFPEMVTVFGYLTPEQLEEAYRNADVVAVPSAYEGFGLPVIQGTIHGAAVVCSQSSALAEVGALCSAYLPESDSAQSWAVALETAIQSGAPSNIQLPDFGANFIEALLR